MNKKLFILLFKIWCESMYNDLVLARHTTKQTLLTALMIARAPKPFKVSMFGLGVDFMLHNQPEIKLKAVREAAAFMREQESGNPTILKDMERERMYEA